MSFCDFYIVLCYSVVFLYIGVFYVAHYSVVILFHIGHVHTAAKVGCQFTFYSLIAFYTHTIH